MALSEALDVLLGLRLDEQGRTWGDLATDVQRRDAEAILDVGSPRRFHAVFRSRGYSKTSDLAGIATAILLAEAPPGAKLYAAAADRDQARLLLDAVERYARLTPGLVKRLAIEAWRVRAPNGAVLEALAADEAGAWGLLPYLVVVDEVAQWSETAGAKRLFDALATAIPKTGGRLVAISTPGSPSHWAYALREHAQADPLWRLAETSGPPPWMPQALLDEQKRRLPESLYARYFEGRWTTADDALVAAEHLRELVREGPEPEPRAGVSYFAGVDVGLVRDRTAVAICHGHAEYDEPEQPRRITNDVSIESIMPRRVADHYGTPIMRRTKVVVDEVRTWRGTRERPVDLDEVEDYLVACGASEHGQPPVYPGLRVELDPSEGGRTLAMRIGRRGVSARTFDFTTRSVGEIAQSLHLLLREKMIELPNDPELLDELLHVRLVERTPGVLRLDHASGKHDDLAVAVALAVRPLAKAGLVARPAMFAGIGFVGAESADPLGPLEYGMGL